MLLYLIGLLLINLLLWKYCNIMMKGNKECVLNTWIFNMNAFVAVLLIIIKILANLFSTNDLFTICDALGLFHFYVLLQSDIH